MKILLMLILLAFCLQPLSLCLEIDFENNCFIYFLNKNIVFKGLIWRYFQFLIFKNEIFCISVRFVLFFKSLKITFKIFLMWGNKHFLISQYFLINFKKSLCFQDEFLKNFCILYKNYYYFLCFKIRNKKLKTNTSLIFGTPT